MEKKVLVETSARHVHVTREALDILFGEGYELTVKKELSQPGQFASNERVAVVGPKLPGGLYSRPRASREPG
jgi:putative phosphotransacetylase